MNPDLADVVLLAAGAGTRLGNGRPKGFAELGGEPLFSYSLRSFLAHRWIARVMLAVPESSIDEARRYVQSLSSALDAMTRVRVVCGGEARQDSTWEALRALRDAGAGDERLVLIHDAARPFVRAALIRRCIEAMHLPWGEERQGRLPGIAAAGEWGDTPAGAIPALPVQDTLKLVYENRVVLTQPRESLFIAQTPQAFRLGAILDAHRRAREVGHVATDDAGLLEWLGIPVRIVEGDGANWKITVPFDLVKAERWLLALAAEGRCWTPSGEDEEDVL